MAISHEDPWFQLAHLVKTHLNKVTDRAPESRKASHELANGTLRSCEIELACPLVMQRCVITVKTIQMV